MSATGATAASINAKTRAASITVRVQAYEHSTAPLIDFYRNLGLLIAVVADGSPAEICDRTVALLESRLQKKREESADQQSISV